MNAIMFFGLVLIVLGVTIVLTSIVRIYDILKKTNLTIWDIFISSKFRKGVK